MFFPSFDAGISVAQNEFISEVVDEVPSMYNQMRTFICVVARKRRTSIVGSTRGLRRLCSKLGPHLLVVLA